MPLRRISFPLRVEHGRLTLSGGIDAAGEALRMLLSTHTGELPLSRDYGADLEYNIPLDIAYAQEQRLSERLARYHPHLFLNGMIPVLSEEGVVLDWTVDIGVQDG